MAVKVHETGYGKWKVPVIIIAVIVVLSLAGTGILLSDSLGVSIEEGSKRIEVAEGDGTSSVAKLLKDNGIIKYPLLFKVQSKLGGYDGNFQPGAATIDDGMSYSDILNLIITPSREAAKITIPEGYEIKQIAQKLDEAGIVSWQDFYAALNPDDYDYAFLKNLPENGVVIKTIVTTELAAAIAHSYGIEIMNVLTGFKYIGEKMTEFAKTGDHTYLIGFEESYGYLVGTHARDKDGVVATMLIAEMAAYYKTKGKSLYEALMDIYKKYGYYSEKTVSFVMPGKDGMEKMSQLLTDLRQTPPTKVAGMDVVLYTDYQSQTIKDTKGNVSPLKGLPKSNVLKYNLSDEKTYFIVRPSGTEPKIKLYLGTFAESFETAEKTIEKVLEDCKKQLGL